MTIRTLGLGIEPPRSIVATPGDAAIVGGGESLAVVWADSRDATSSFPTPTVAAGGELTALLRGAAGILIVRRDGAIASLPGSPPEIGELLPDVNRAAAFAGDVARATRAAWLGNARVAACIDGGAIAVAGVEDEVTVEYHSPHSGFAEVAASAGRIAAITGDRQRLVVWRLDRPEAPILDVHLVDRTRTRLADVAFA